MDENSNLSIDEANESITDAKENESTEQYLTFFMAKEEFGVNILSVQEIRGWEAVTTIPNAPPHIKGVMNLRGTVIPIVDLRMCFDIDDIQYTEETVVIILTIHSGSTSKVLGVVVDAVSDVHNFSLSDIQGAPDLASQEQAQYVRGLGRTEEKMVILLEVTEQLLSDISTQKSDLVSA